MTRQDDNIYIAQVENGLNWLQVTRSRTELSPLYWSIGTLQQFQRAKAAMSNYQSVTRAYPPLSLCQEWGETLCCDELVSHSPQFLIETGCLWSTDVAYEQETETREMKDHLSGMTKTTCLTCRPFCAGHSKRQQFCLMPISRHGTGQIKQSRTGVGDSGHELTTHPLLALRTTELMHQDTGCKGTLHTCACKLLDS